MELRALQLEAFLDEVHRFGATGEQSEELAAALMGAFVRSMTPRGLARRATTSWPTTRRCAPCSSTCGTASSAPRRSAWSSPSRARRPGAGRFYAFYLGHPHPSRSMRDAIEAARRGRRATRRTAEALKQAERAAVEESWRLERDRAPPRDRSELPRRLCARRRHLRSWGLHRGRRRRFRAWLMNHPEGRSRSGPRTTCEPPSRPRGVE